MNLLIQLMMLLVLMMYFYNYLHWIFCLLLGLLYFVLCVFDNFENVVNNVENVADKVSDKVDNVAGNINFESIFLNKFVDIF